MTESPDANAARLLLIDRYMHFLNIRAREYFPGRRLEDARQLLMILGIAFSKNMRKVPATVSALARRTGLSRATIRRRLDEITAAGWIDRRGLRYYCNLAKLAEPKAIAIIRAAKRDHLDIAKKLAAMDI